MKRLVTGLAAALALCAANAFAQAPAFPTKAVTFVVPLNAAR